jgi:hypothetical protein
LSHTPKDCVIVSGGGRRPMQQLPGRQARNEHAIRNLKSLNPPMMWARSLRGPAVLPQPTDQTMHTHAGSLARRSNWACCFGVRAKSPAPNSGRRQFMCTFAPLGSAVGAAAAGSAAERGGKLNRTQTSVVITS